MIIEHISTDALIPYARNARTNDQTVDSVAASIAEFGWQQPIVIDAHNIIVAGHTRHKAAQKLRLETVPCIRADNLTEAQVRAYRLLDNKLQEKSTWDVEMLNFELEDLDFDFTPFDVEFFEIEKIEEQEAPELKSGDREPFQQITFTLHDEQAEQVKIAIEKAKKIGPFESKNENSNGNALARIAEIFNGQS